MSSSDIVSVIGTGKIARHTWRVIGGSKATSRKSLAATI